MNKTTKAIIITIVAVLALMVGFVGFMFATGKIDDLRSQFVEQTPTTESTSDTDISNQSTQAADTGREKTPMPEKAIAVVCTPDDFAAENGVRTFVENVYAYGCNTVVIDLTHGNYDEALIKEYLDFSSQSRVFSGALIGKEDAAALAENYNFDFIVLDGFNTEDDGFFDSIKAVSSGICETDPEILLGFSMPDSVAPSSALDSLVISATVNFIYVKQSSYSSIFLNSINKWGQHGATVWFAHSLDGIGAMSAADMASIIPTIEASFGSHVCQATVFDSYSDILSSKGGGVELLTDYINEQDTSLIDKNFKITNLSKNSITVEESKITFTGQSSPVYPLTCNSKDIQRTESGDFSTEFELKKGENRFVFEHKGKQYTYTVTYKVQLLKSITPTGTLSAPGGMQVSISAVALKGAAVVATVNGKKVTLRQSSDISYGDDEELIDETSDFAAFYGNYTLPKETDKIQKLGKITVTATYGSLSESMTGASLSVSAKEPEPVVTTTKPTTAKPTTVKPTTTLTETQHTQTTSSTAADTETSVTDTTGSDTTVTNTTGSGTTEPGTTVPDTTEPTTQSTTSSSNDLLEKFSFKKDYGLGKAKICYVTEGYAECFPANITADLSNPFYIARPAGMCDYVTGTMNASANYYILASGSKVYQSDVTYLASAYRVPDNNIRVASSSVTASELKIVLDMNWRVPVNAVLDGQKYGTININGNARPHVVETFTANAITFTFYNTDSASGSISTNGSVISKADWSSEGSTAKLKFTFKNSGKFYGYHIEYDSYGRLVITFRNKPSQTLKGYTIMLDPGHGGNDPGALCCITSNPSMKYEKQINFSLATKLKALLEAEGATVLMTRTTDTFIDLDPRVDMCREKHPDMFIAMHCDSSTGSAPMGTSAYYYNAYSYNLAKELHNSIVKCYKTDIYAGQSSSVLSKVDRKTSFYPFKVTRVEECPAILIEYGFVSNMKECAVLQDSANRDKLAAATLEGIKNYIKAN